MPENYSKKCPNGLILRATGAESRAAALLKSLPIAISFRCQPAAAAVADAVSLQTAAGRPFVRREPELGVRSLNKPRLKLSPSRRSQASNPLKAIQKRGLNIA
ncbi:hypothetical protein [Leisingera sp. McT4-56]|uniref:hypothetical protein n=1 Tax=Leisingera sp. McT4-56 TaxID=2881255 RepID=UPI001CF90509|nr:hypothetical protein [Leisingera sp. McT4-56]MCB4456286.1 hypothetical protein [Leisingera sp. McT4-56]